MADQPDFLCVGAQKAATTWVHYSLARLPGIFMPVIKESHFFRESSQTSIRCPSKRRRSKIAKFSETIVGQNGLHVDREMMLRQLEHFDAEHVDDDWYRTIFSFANDGDLRGEACPSYFGLLEEDIEHVNAIAPDARIILLVRDPLDRCWSNLRMNRRKREGFEFDQVFADPDGLKYCLENTAYDQAIPRWRSGVGDRLRVFLFDDIMERPDETLGQLLDHIGYRHNGEIEPGEPRNVGDPTPIPHSYRERLYHELQGQYEFLEQIYPERVARWRARHEQSLCKAA